MQEAPDLRQKSEKLNKLPVNQYAKKFLEKAGVKPDPNVLYLLQLVEWGLLEDVVSVNELNDLKTGLEPPLQERARRDQARVDFLELVRRLIYSNHPEKIMDVLLKEGISEDEPWVDPEVLRWFLERKEPPECAAQYLAENLQAALTWNEPPNPLRD